MNNSCFYLMFFLLFVAGNSNKICVDQNRQDPPLTPTKGGRSIDGRSLKQGDILFSSTNSVLSAIVRIATGGGPASHVAVVTDVIDNETVFVVDALMSKGVRKVNLQDFLKESSTVVAFRYPNLSVENGAAISQYLSDRLGAPYDFWGSFVAVSPFFMFHDKKVQVDYGEYKTKGTFCSKLMLESYQSVNIDLTEVAGDWTPNAVVTLTWTDILEYVGHLKYTK